MGEHGARVVCMSAHKHTHRQLCAIWQRSGNKEHPGECRDANTNLRKTPQHLHGLYTRESGIDPERRAPRRRLRGGRRLSLSLNNIIAEVEHVTEEHRADAWNQIWDHNPYVNHQIRIPELPPDFKLLSKGTVPAVTSGRRALILQPGQHSDLFVKYNPVEASGK